MNAGNSTDRFLFFFYLHFLSLKGTILHPQSSNWGLYEWNCQINSAFNPSFPSVTKIIKSPFDLAQPRRGAKIHLSSESWEYSTTISPSYMHPHIHKGNNMC